MSEKPKCLPHFKGHCISEAFSEMSKMEEATILSSEPKGICMNRFKLCPSVWFWKLNLGKESAKPVGTTDACHAS